MASSGLLVGIHGLRGAAALAVIAYHVNQMAKIPLPRGWSFVAWSFGHAVHLFFVLSAFSLLHSCERHGRSEPGWVVEYGIRRFFRIAPLFYAMVLWYVGPFATFSGQRHGAAGVALNLALLFNLAGQQSSVVWAGWSVGVEVLFYAAFPILATTLTTSRRTLAALTAAGFVGYAAHLLIARSSSEREAYVAFASNGFVFLFGFLAYRVYTHPRWAAWLDTRFASLAALLPIVLLCVAGRHLRAPGRPDLFLWAAAFGLVCATQARHPSALMRSRALLHAGERSFSVYLVHPPVLFLLAPVLGALASRTAPWLGAWTFLPCVLAATGATLAAAEVTYRLIEKPGIRAGRWWIETRRAARARRGQPVLGQA